MISRQTKRQSSDKTKKGKAKEPLGKENKSRFVEILEVLLKHDIVRGLTPLKLRLILEDLGPTFVKIGQIMSMRQDILSSEYCDELIKLRTDVTPVPFEEIREVLEEEYASNYKDIFDSFDQTPLGSASIAQVHKALLKSKSVVVVKVQRKGIKRIMARDIALLRRAVIFLKLASKTGDTIDFNKVLDEMWDVTQQEMDFLFEASNTEHFAELNNDVKYVECPKIEKKYTTTHVLVMEYIDGIQIDDLDKLIESGYDLNEIGIKLAENYVKQVIEDSFFQADPHPGNIKIRDGKIVWIDLGMIGRLTLQDRDFIKNGVKALAEHDIFELQNVILSLGEYKNRINHSRLYLDIDDMLTKYATKNLSQLDLGIILKDFISVAKSHGITMPRGITMLSRGILTIEGVLAKLSPDINIVEIMVNHMKVQKVYDYDIKKKSIDAGKLLYLAGKKTLEIPPNFVELLKMTVKGQTKINLELMGSEEPLHTIDKMVNKLILCIINSAILLASSLISTTNMTPKVLGIPLLGFFGYLTALFLSVILIWDIIKKK